MQNIRCRFCCRAFLALACAVFAVQGETVDIESFRQMSVLFDFADGFGPVDTPEGATLTIFNGFFNNHK